MGIVKSVGSAIGGGVGNLFGGIAGGMADNAPPMSTDQRGYYKADVDKYSGMANDQTYQNYLANINAQMTGQGPSVADVYARNAGQQAVANSNAIAASARGNVNPAMALRSAQTAGAQGQQQAMQQGALMKQQEALNAMTLAQGTRAQNLDMEKTYQDFGLKADTAQTNVKNQFAGGGMGGLAGVGAAAAPGMMASDENLKKNVKSGDKSISDFLDALKAHSYNYKDPEADGHGEFVSPMAQELEKTPLGKNMVQDTPRGKMVDYGKGFGAVLAAQAMLHERMKKLEK